MITHDKLNEGEKGESTSFIQQTLLSTCCVPGIVLGVEKDRGF